MRLATSLEQLADNDPSVASLARLQVVALAAAEDTSWSDGVPALTLMSDRAPVLDGQTLVVDSAQQRDLLVALAKALEPDDVRDAGRLTSLFGSRAFDLLDLLAASIQNDTAVLEAAAQHADADVAVLGVVAHVSILPLLLACGDRAAATVQDAGWSHGYCPVCGAFPALAELRGLARERVLRCGRCATGWPIEHDRCPFCETRDQSVQGYLAAEAERESRRAVTCDACRGYLKTVTTLAALSPAELLLRDLETLALDIAALEHEYSRPDGLGWPLRTRIEAAPERRAGWRLGERLGWSR